MTSAGRVVVDTGVLLAAADADDRWHERAADLLTSRSGDELVVPAPVVTEAAWMIGSRLGAATEAAFVSSIAAGDLALADLIPQDWSPLRRADRRLRRPRPRSRRRQHHRRG